MGTLVNSMFYTKDCVCDQNIVVGDHTYGSPEIIFFGDQSKLTIGKYCSISENVKIVLNSEHKLCITSYPFYSVKMNKHYKWVDKPDKHYGLSKGDVVIGNDVWIGYNVTILSGVTIGDGAILGLNSTVTKDVPPYTIVAGNPAREIRKRFHREIIEKLLYIQWWNWSDQKVKDNLELMKDD